MVRTVSRAAKPGTFEADVLPLFEASPSRAAWLAEARAAAHRLGEGGRAITVNDVRAVCPPPPGFDPRVLGAVLRGRDWVRVGFVGSERGACHGRPIGRFVRRDFADA